ncbi:MAG: type pilus assembly protein PilC [Solirubrobacteraceae bacterium]|jgi:type IV pilus assembly protein PilC|nr:type pilus assembly protein PilC [Solirubrobacteraceae bacterium]MEA2275225.1 type pilus assembly protein PilC [Solirubrobacteraceae bacterium]MEA2358251.1 type pilus assembly protein PilC [Solirubrobacteraceae bacterium]MEA2394329.1 type pilus assembly protein PilC [Solirubrobacteraceae bacterium]
MATYVFKAMDLTGAKAAGEVEAESKQIVSDQLKSRGLIVVDIAEKGGSKQIELPFVNRIKPADLTIMTRQLATMVSSGMTILRSLYVLEAQTENKKLAETLSKVRKDVEAGLSFSHSLERHPKVFNTIYIAMVRAGETGGVLEDALIRVADQLEKDDALRRQIKAAMVYPGVVLSFALLILVALVTFIVPVFVGVFKQFGGDLPAITKITVGLSAAMRGYWWAILALVFGAVWLFKRWKDSYRGRGQWDAFRLRIPMKIGDIVQKVALARWSSTLSALVAAGVPLLAALDITSKTAGNRVVENAMTDVIESVKRGGTIAAPLKDASVFPGMVAQMVAVGEETGALDSMLRKIAEFYEDQVDAAVKALTSILEPVMLVVVGGIVGFIVISMYMPLFKVYDQIR